MIGSSVEWEARALLEAVRMKSGLGLAEGVVGFDAAFGGGSGIIGDMQRREEEGVSGDAGCSLSFGAVYKGLSLY